MSDAAAATAPKPVLATRAQLFQGLFLLAALNAFAGRGIRDVATNGFLPSAFNLFGISAILWLALAAGLKILAEGEPERLRRGDLAMACLVALAALLPVTAAAGVGLTLASAWAIATGRRGGEIRRAGIVFLAVTGGLLWGQVLLALLGRLVLDLDTFLVAKSLGVASEGNLVWSADHATRLIVAPGCSAVQGMSLAFVFWATVNQFFRVRFGWRAVLTCLAALAATVAVNVLRIGAMLRWPEHLEAIHTGWGYHVAMWATLILVVAICLTGARREIFARA